MKQALLVFILSIAALAQRPVAELPRIFIDDTYSLPTGGTTWAVHDVTQFRAALTGSVPGDVIVMDAGTDYRGNFILPAKTNPNHKWIYIISSDLASLPAYGTCVAPWNPAPGTCVRPSDAVHMPRITGLTNGAAIHADYGANYWRLVGIEGTANSNYPTGCGTYILPCNSGFIFDAAVDNIHPRCDHIYFDRVYFHGDTYQDFGFGIQPSLQWFSITGSYISDIHRKNSEAHGFGANATLGPGKIDGNFIEASTQNVMFGGGGVDVTQGVPSDIQITRNHLFKRLSWVADSFNGRMAVKNSLEIKCGQRILIDSNVMENSWQQAQSGYAMLLTVRTGQTGNFCVDNDINVTNNILKNVVSGVDLIAVDNNCGPGTPYPSCTDGGEAIRINISNNLLTSYNPNIQGGSRNIFATFQPSQDTVAGQPYHMGQLKDLIVTHNTQVQYPGAPCWGGFWIGNPSILEPPSGHHSENLWFVDNVFCKQFGADGGMHIDAALPWPTTPPYDFANRVAGNVMMQPPAIVGLPPSNTVVVSPTFDANYQLLVPDWRAHTTDGLQAGYSATGIVTGLAYNSPISLSAGMQGVPYGPVSVIATGGTTPYAYSLQSGAWPTGITLNVSTGIISGTPSVSGTFSPNIKVCDSAGTPACVTSGVLTLLINPNVGTLTITNTHFNDGTLNEVYTFGALTASGGTPPYTWDLDPSNPGSLPPGLAIIDTAILGTPTAIGTYTFRLRVTDSTAATAVGGPFTITINNLAGIVVGPGITLGPGVVVK